MIPNNLVFIFFMIALSLTPSYKTLVILFGIGYVFYNLTNQRKANKENTYKQIEYFSKYDESTVTEIIDKLDKFYLIKEKLESSNYPYKANNIKTCRLLRGEILNLLGGITHSLHGDDRDNNLLKETIKKFKKSLLDDIIYLVDKHNNPKINNIDFTSGCIDFIGVEPRDPNINKNLDLL